MVILMGRQDPLLKVYDLKKVWSRYTTKEVGTLP